MPTLVFAKQFLDDFAKLEPTVRQKVRELPDKFEDAAHTGAHLELLTGSLDQRVRTIRVDKFWRGVVVKLGEGRYALLRVMPHDDANKWAVRQKFGVNPATGIVEILDVPTVKETVDTLKEVEDADVSGMLFADRKDKDFTRLGVDEHLIPILRRLNDDTELLAIASYLPNAQADAVLLLADGTPVEEAWAEIQASYLVPAHTEVDTEDLDTALNQPGTKSGFVVTTTDTELVDLLTGDFEAWRTFLHPTQRSLAEKPTYNGPAKVTGGAGTGKTVVALHRARFLAQRLIDTDDAAGRILVATYTKSLATNLDRTLRTFCTPEQYGRLNVTTVDSLAQQALGAGAKNRPAMDSDLRDIANSVVAMSGLDDLGLDGRFLLAEWEQVILARQLHTFPEYATSARPGRGTRLTRPGRKAVWEAIERLTTELAGKGRSTYLQLADRAADTLAARTTRPYAHAVIDEAQDLHPAQWRLIRAAVPAGPNDLFIVGDAHQRIYDYRVSLSFLGIETRGRSRRLKINYRTSQQILHWAQQILTGQPIDDLDGEIEEETGYRSSFTGPPPVVQNFTTAGQEADHVAEAIVGWLAEGVSASAIGVTGRTRAAVKPVQEALERRSIGWTDLGADKPGVRIGTMHSAKGLEFARLAVVGVSTENVPLPAAVTPKATDETQHDHDLLRERCLLYVACTRTRDELLVTSAGTPSPFLTAVTNA